MDRVNGNNPVDIGGGRRGFRSQNAAAGVAGTEVTVKYLNDVQEEICQAIELGGGQLDPENNRQLAQTVQAGSYTFAVANGTANALTITLSPIPLAYYDGLRALLRVGSSSTSVVPTLNVNGLGEKTIVNPDGSSLQKGALVAGAVQMFCFDAVRGKFILLTSANTGVLIGNNWMRHSDGSYEAWGEAEFTGTNYEVILTLPITFPNSIVSALLTDTGNGVFPGAAKPLSLSQITAWVPRY